MIKNQIDVILDEARRFGVYVLDKDERRAIEGAKKSELATEAEVRAFWSRHGVE